MAITLALGSFVFQDAEIPEHIKIRTQQRLAVHRFIGGARQIDVLGTDHDPIAFSGWLTGSNAMQRALTLKAMKDSGQEVTLSWSQWLYNVVIGDFAAEYQRDYQIPYSITIIVSDDLTNNTSDGGTDSIDDLINGDMTTASSLASPFSALSSPMSSLQSAISAVSTFANAAKSTVASVLQPLQAVQSQVSTLIASTDNTLLSVSTVGGILPGNPLSQQVTALTSQVTAMANQGSLIQLSGVLGRIGLNLGQINTGIRTVNVGSGNAYDLASKYYGDTSGWTAIMQANPQLGSDPNISGFQTITIPPYSGGSGGILSA
ncbi:hypothetical protein [Paraburkholderia phosphatilytica]|uniref:hypothetical protein n=1 Tax=Paraburkholderia phosphatilytica TaxID=2282883 RepID=UPI000E51E66A|nr:hypothetical protein [Paraburkholderia phosphatilytica]